MARSNQKARLVLSAAVASLALASCTSSAPPAQVSFTKAQGALEKGKVDKAITYAEAAVLASPRDPEYRATLGTAYLEAGRFESAATAFGEAMELGDIRGRTALTFALTKVAIGDNRAAVQALQARQSSVSRADLGLALALAGEADRGVEILIDTIREGNASPKARQNLAYAYALAGNWRAARVMAAEDVPVDQLDARLSDWAASARPEDYMLRVSNLLGLKPVRDGGQPQHLALANFPTQPALAAEAAQLAELDVEKAPSASPAQPRESESMSFANSQPEDASVSAAPAVLARSTTPAQVVVPATTPSPVAAPAPAQPPAPRFVSNAVVQNVPVSVPAPSVAARPAPKRASAPTRNAGSAPSRAVADTHHVQLGAFNSRQVAEQKWGEFQRRYPSLKGHDVVITEAEVNGRTFFRVAAAGFGSRSARSLCGTVKASGGGCFAYAKSSPPAGAVKRDVRVAARTR
ncbi:SPOR domain-containing protein [uncultured Erythrobacter sp.]|uniref:SPOR domain-containing protein n=1 Tax=uncultured Erythrobacter sp. TaxID=263913 RepID=UPI0026282C16|nr:SPOR domain-containing protein [uncultured Erythrobacter sp.]